MSDSASHNGHTREFKFMYFNGVELIPLHLDDWTFHNGVLCHRNAPLFPVVQSTGLHDKNGKEIYEGDILIDIAPDKEAPNGTHYTGYLPIFFENGCFWVDESFEKNGTSACMLAEWNKPEVVGNIYENPELLKR